MHPGPAAAVAVVVPCFNAARYLGDTLASIRAQDVEAWVCVVVDDGSTDDTAAVAMGFVDADPRFTLLRQDNAGPSAARNAALATLPGDVRLLAFVDGDDLWDADALSTLMRALEADPAAVGVYGLAEYIDADGIAVSPGAHPAGQRDRRQLGGFDLASVPVEAPTTFSTLAVASTIWPSAVALHRRDAVERAGGFDPELRRAEDWDLYLRMSRFGDFVPVDRRVAWYRRHGAQATSDAGSMAQACAVVRHKSWSSDANDRAQRRELSAVWRRLAARWTVWTAQAAVAAARRGRLRETGRALSGAVFFAALTVLGRPTRPSARFVRLTVDHVVERSTGAGGSPP